MTPYELLIIGGGPAGTAAAVYAARKKVRTAFVTESFGGQSVDSDDIQNWIGTPHVTGQELAERFEKHVKEYASDMVDVKTGDRVTGLSAHPHGNSGKFFLFEAETKKGEHIQAHTVIIASGARRKKLGIPGEDTYNAKGVSYCSSCDAPLFPDKKVAVIGGGNAGLEAVQDLFPYAAEVYLLEYSDSLKGDPVTQEDIKRNSKLKQIILNAQTTEIFGDVFVEGLKYKDRTSEKETSLEVQGIFVEIGSIPNSELVKELVELDEMGQIKIDSKYATTSHPAIFAAGDVTDDPFKQNNISAGDAVKALFSAYRQILNLRQEENR